MQFTVFMEYIYNYMMRMRKMRRLLTKLRGGSYSRAAGGDGEMERFEDGGQEVS